MRFWSKVTAIMWKDVLSEMRTKEVISSVLVFAFLVIVIFNFAFSGGQDIMRLVAPGILWVTFAFSGVLSINRSFVVEKEESCLDGLRICPAGWEVIYLGKMLGSLLFLLVIEVMVLPIFTVLFNLSVLTPQVITVALLTTVGFVIVGTLFSALAINTKAREMVLPILFLPIIIPLLIAAVKASGLALAGEPWSGLSIWLQVIGAFDVIFLVVSLLVFPYILEE